MYIKKISLENFQSHAFTEIELPPGLTIIVGESDRGKSAIIRALRWVFENEPSGTEFIRAGTRTCRVSVETNEGVTVIRERTPTRNRYIVKYADGREETFEGFRNEIPAEVIAAHGVTRAKLDSDLEVSLNIASQLDGPFLLSSPGSVKAKAIGRLYKVHLIDAATRDTSQDIAKLGKESTQIDNRLNELEKKLAEFDDLPDIENRLKKAGRLMEKINHFTERKNNLTQIHSKLTIIYSEKKQLTITTKKLSLLDKASQLYQTAKNLTGKKQELAVIHNKLKTTGTQLRSVRVILGDTANIEECQQQYERLLNISAMRFDLANSHTKLSRINRERMILTETERQTQLVPDGIKQQQLLEDNIIVYSSLCNSINKLNDLKKQQKKYLSVTSQTEKIQLASVKRELVSRLEQKYLTLVSMKNLLGGLKQTIAGENVILRRTDSLPAAFKRYDILAELPNKLSEMSNYSSRHQKLSDRIKNGHEFLEQKEAEILLAINEYSAQLKKLGQCPTCFSRVDHVTIEHIVSKLK